MKKRTGWVRFSVRMSAYSAGDGDGHGHGALAARGTLEAVADLCRVDLQFRDGATEGVAVHAKLGSGLALVATVVGEDLKQVTALELAHGFIVRNTAAMHLRHYAFKFSLHIASQIGDGESPEIHT